MESEAAESSENTPEAVSDDSNIDNVQSNDQVLEDMCIDYAKYVKVDCASDEKLLDDSIEDLLTKLEEYCGLVDLIRSDTSLCLSRTLPQIQAKSEQMNDVFQKIDDLEKFVAIVKSNVASVEGLLDEAEAEKGTMSGMKKLFSFAGSFLGRKPAPASPSSPVASFKPPELFSTDDYFPSDKR